jgi:hypothetical protein
MTTSEPEPLEVPLDADTEPLPPEHPAGPDTPVSAGEAISGEGPGSGALDPRGGGTGEPPAAERVPGDGS